MPGITARIVKPDGSLAGFNEPGELIVKCPATAIGYYNNPKACVHASFCCVSRARELSVGVEHRTAETFRDGWVWTGDEVIINEKMELFVKDRIKVRLCAILLSSQ